MTEREEDLYFAELNDITPTVVLMFITDFVFRPT